MKLPRSRWSSSNSLRSCARRPAATKNLKGHSANCSSLLTEVASSVW